MDTNYTLLIPTKQIVSSHVIVPPNINLLFTKHGSLSINDGISVTINGSLKAELQPIFTGEHRFRDDKQEHNQEVLP